MVQIARPISTGLLLIDGVVLLLCLADVLRIHALGLSLRDVVSVSMEAAREGESVVLSIIVFATFMMALPMLCALLEAALHSKTWVTLLRPYGWKIFVLHLLIAVLLAGFTAAEVTAEVLSGFVWVAKAQPHSYRYVSWWLVIVFLGQPIWALYISPIIRKFLIRASGDHKRDFSEVVKEVVTEDGVAEHG